MSENSLLKISTADFCQFEICDRIFCHGLLAADFPPRLSIDWVLAADFPPSDHHDQNLITGDGNLPEPRNDRRLYGTLILGSRGIFRVQALYDLKGLHDVAGR